MKVLLPLALLAFASCGKIDMPKDAELGISKSTNAVVKGASETGDLNDLCAALRERDVTISSLVNTNYVFAGTTKSCTETGFANLGDSTVMLVNQGGNYKFQEGSNLFYFSEVETASGTDGLLSKICAQGSTYTSPISLDSTNLLYFTTKEISRSDCPDVANNQRCVKIEKGIRTTNSQGVVEGVIHTREWIRVRLEQPNLGFYTFKKRIAQAGCLDGQYFGRTATLK